MNSLLHKPDWEIAAIVGIMLGIGLVTIYSSSGIYALERFGNSSYFFTRQLLWIVLGIIAGFFAMQFDHRKLKFWTRPLLAVSIILLVAVLFLGHSVGGASRWLRIGGIGFQPSELAKLSLILFTAYYCDKKHSRIEHFLRGLFPLLLVLGFVCGLIFVQPDLGTPALILATCLTIIFLGGAKIMQFASLFGVVSFLVGIAIWMKPYRRKRLLAFLNPWEDVHGTSYQLIQSLLAMGSGGLVGVGLGDSHSKLMYLPEPHTDFIFPILAEEWGIVGSFAILALFARLAWKGFQVAVDAPELFSTLLAGGITTLILYQACFNIAMVTGCIPTKRLPLPFISFGGSSLVISLTMIGILLNISRFSPRTNR